MIYRLILGFLPWIVFDAMPMKTHYQMSIIVIIALILTIILNFNDLKKLYILPCGTVLFFIFALIAVMVFKNNWIVKNMWLCINGALASIVWFSLIIGKPFTMQYAKQEVSPDKWNHPIFVLINRILTGIWGLVFLFNFCVNLFRLYYSINHWVAELITYLVLIFGIWFTIWFPKYYKDMVKRRLANESIGN